MESNRQKTEEEKRQRKRKAMITRGRKTKQISKVK